MKLNTTYKKFITIVINDLCKEKILKQKLKKNVREKNYENYVVFYFYKNM